MVSGGQGLRNPEHCRAGGPLQPRGGPARPQDACARPGLSGSAPAADVTEKRAVHLPPGALEVGVPSVRGGELSRGRPTKL